MGSPAAARPTSRVSICSRGGVGGDLIPPRNFVKRSSAAGDSNGHQQCDYHSVGQKLSAGAIIRIRNKRHEPLWREMTSCQTNEK